MTEPTTAIAAAITEATEQLDALTATITDLRGQNERLRSELRHARKAATQARADRDRATRDHATHAHIPQYALVPHVALPSLWADEYMAIGNTLAARGDHDAALIVYAVAAALYDEIDARLRQAGA